MTALPVPASTPRPGGTGARKRRSKSKPKPKPKPLLTTTASGVVISDHWTDAQRAAQFARQALLDRFRYCSALGGWLRWTGRIWRECGQELIIETCRRWAVNLLAAAVARSAAPDEQVELLVLQSAKSIMALVALVRGIPGVLTLPEEFDDDPDKLNCWNGLLYLRTGDLMPHHPGMLVTRITRTRYVPGATHPDFTAALEAVPVDIRGWYQERMSQGVTGYPPPDDRLLIQVGSGENGKSALMGVLQQALGEYSITVSHRALLADPSAHSTELADFRDSRLAVLEELPEERRLQMARVKLLVGTPWVTARKIRRDDVRFKATWSSVVNCNSLPSVVETTHGDWRRLVAVPFPFVYRKPGESVIGENDRPGDPQLKQRLLTGLDGQHEAALAWLVDGARRWYAAGRVMRALPDRVQRATDQWRLDEDLIAAWAPESIVLDPDGWVPVRDLFIDFDTWLRGGGHTPWSDKTFAKRFDIWAEQHRYELPVATVRAERSGLSRRPPDLYAPPLKGSTVRARVGLRFVVAGAHLEPWLSKTPAL
jgi:putative DNA primase/helicase